MGDGEEVSLALDAVDCDAVRLEALSSEGSRASLAAAVELYQDPLLADVNIAEEAWADWLDAERLRLEGLALDAMIRHAEQALQSGDAESSLKSARRAIAVNALREDAHRLVVRALAATGRKAEALKHYQDLVLLLKRELNVEPDAATKSLVAELRSASSAMVGESPKPAPFHSGAEGAGNQQSGDERSFAGELRPVGLEQRQLTIMVCNMVNLAPLSARLDPEDIHDLVTAFQESVVNTVARFDGFVAQYEGNGVLVYFGYPAAHEHDAEQAVRASFAILAAGGPLKAPSSVTLQASIGIATGIVVVGERPGAGDRGRVAIGETPNLAARLQAAAPSGEIVIDESTRQLVGRRFDCSRLAGDRVNGLPQAVEAWQVFGERPDVSRFEARHVGALSLLVGRQEETELLLRRWVQASGGEGRVVLLSGEPGIGKSRIAEDLLDGLEGKQHACVRYSCSPHHTNSPLYPFMVQLERAARFEPGSDAGARLDRLEALLRPTSKNVVRDVALLAELLGRAGG
jgi:class 3 adenylate cyclase